MTTDSFRITLAVAISLLAHLPNTATAQDLAVHTGAVFFPWFYGQTPGSGAAARDLSGHLGTDLTFKVADSVHVGGSVDGAYVRGTFDATSGFVYSVAAGPTGMLTSDKWTRGKLLVGLSFTPAVLFQGGVPKQGDRRHSVTVGGATELSLRVRVTQRIFLGGFASFGLYAPPLGGGVWRGKKLGVTAISYFDLGLIWRF